MLAFEVVIYGGSQVSEWLETLDPSFGSNTLLVGSRISTLSENHGILQTSAKSFSNQAEYLLVTSASINALSRATGLDWETVMRRFRPNFVIETYNVESDTRTPSELPFQEDTFSEVHIGSVGFDVSGPCTRCQMICIDQETGEKDPNILVSLRDMRREYAQCTPSASKLAFGVYLSLKRNKDDKRIKVLLLSNTELRVGSPVRISYKTMMHNSMKAHVTHT
ncbi:MOSC domain-containing protein [Ditylenchus destructor]|uniref:MOSC domain-containing protein n=1 Tax=Ditylenchus destructor TaxID=166010 RepID=A0AAD4R2Y3_9BILA|nr:MOSC domain-containing protein [Ditylenchus destructor]